MKELLVKKWDESYSRLENNIFYPKEEIVKFLNRFVRRKTGMDTFTDLINLENDTKALDFGCGIGRQTILLSEFGFDSYGIDISDVAVKKARELASILAISENINFSVSNGLQIHFDDNYFTVAVCDSVLDSMYFSNALEIIKELDRTVSGSVYLNLISSENNPTGKANDQVVQEEHEKGTIQTYYDEERIKDLLKETSFKVLQLNINRTESLLTSKISSRYHIVLTNKA